MRLTTETGRDLLVERDADELVEDDGPAPLAKLRTPGISKDQQAMGTRALES